MIFESAELRWFSLDKDLYKDIFNGLASRSEARHEKERTDYYLNLDSSFSGLKIRNGKLELKIRSAPDIHLPYGPVQHWKKWSFNEEDPILSAIPSDLQKDWIKVIKKRQIKIFELALDGQIRLIVNERIKTGCSIEYTEVMIPDVNINYKSIALEAFNLNGNCTETLRKTIEGLKLDLSLLSRNNCYAYPDLLSKIFHMKN
jgi:hypothetical protein